MKTIAIEVITPENAVYKDAAEFVLIPARRGPMGVLPGHAPFIGRLSGGSIRIEAAGRFQQVLVGNGVFEVSPDKIMVMADTAELSRSAALDNSEGR